MNPLAIFGIVAGVIIVLCIISIIVGFAMYSGSEDEAVIIDQTKTTTLGGNNFDEGNFDEGNFDEEDDELVFLDDEFFDEDEFFEDEDFLPDEDILFSEDNLIPENEEVTILLPEDAEDIEINLDQTEDGNILITGQSEQNF